MSEPSLKPAEAAVRRQKEEGWWETVKVIVQALLIALVVRTVLFQPFNIPSGSLIPTLLVGDYLFVSKYSYGYSHFSLPGFLDLAPTAMPGRLFASQPKRGDIIVFKLPRDGQTDYIKRLIGLPGRQDPDDQGPALHQRRDSPARAAAALMRRSAISASRSRRPHYIETLPGGVKHEIIQLDGDDGDLRQHRRLRRAARPLFHDGRQPRQFQRFALSPRSGRRRLCAVRESDRPRRDHLLLGRRRRRRPGNSGAGRGRCAGAACSMPCTEAPSDAP